MQSVKRSPDAVGKLYRVHVDQNLCKGCGICVDMCPAKALSLSRYPNQRGYHYAEQTGKCIGCRICEWYCPDFAIAVEEVST